MSKINAFTLNEPDTCVRCGQDMAVGTEVSWLRGLSRRATSTRAAWIYLSSRACSR
jgi:hypothetical protein